MLVVTRIAKNMGKTQSTFQQNNDAGCMESAMDNFIEHYLTQIKTQNYDNSTFPTISHFHHYLLYICKRSTFFNCNHHYILKKDDEIKVFAECFDKYCRVPLTTHVNLFNPIINLLNFLNCPSEIVDGWTKYNMNFPCYEINRKMKQYIENDLDKLKTEKDVYDMNYVNELNCEKKNDKKHSS